MPRWLSVPPLACLLAALTFAVPPESRTAKKAAPPSDAEQAASRARVEGRLKVEAWAAEPLLANPVAFAFDEKGRCYVAETFRHTDGVTDTRGHMYWLDDDLACRSVADRVAMFKKHKYPRYENNAEQLRVVWDSTGSGHADKSEVFSGGYNQYADGIAAGVLARKGEVYFTCIPDLYKLTDTNGDGKADKKQSLASGFGVHVQFLGHDLHGLRMGPDGMLYFTVGDRGLNVATKDGKKLFNPDSGCVLRCDLDGTNLEIVHRGLRNPQELAFDDYGNLFTYDNNSDSGDQARWVQIVEGGDSGWRCGYQFGTLMHNPTVPQGNRGPWNTEQIWHVPDATHTPPAYIVPALANFGNGPSGITHYPGVGLSDKYKDHFFACDFTAGPNSSKIWSLAVKAKGASFEVADLKPFVQNMVPTDCEFGPDGAFYWLDWTGGWNKPNKGRIFRVTDPDAMKNPAVAEAKKLLAEGFEQKSVAELAKLLEFPHQLVRQEAQFEMVRQTLDQALARVLNASKNRTARLHAIWGLGMCAQTHKKDTSAELVAVLNDADPQIRANALKVLATFPFPVKVAWEQSAKLVADPEPRVRYFAALAYPRIALAHEKRTPSIDVSTLAPLFGVLRANADSDAYLRHAAVQGLVASTHNPGELVAAWKQSGAKYDTPAVRLGVVLALRKLQAPQLAEFLSDSDPRVVAEAARAIYDQALMAPMPELAKLADKPVLPDVVVYRALAANFKLGKPENAARLANFAARASETGYLREMAMKLLAEWAKPSRRDPIVGVTQSLPERPAQDAVAAIRPVLHKLFVGPESVRKQAVQVTVKLGIQDVGPLMAGIVTDAKQPASMRVDALFALEAVKAKQLADATTAALASTEPKLRAAARVVKAKADPVAAMRELPALLKQDGASLVEKQMALEVMGTLRESKEIDAALLDWLDKYLVGQVPAGLKLDVLEAAQARANAKKLKLHAPLRERLREIDRAARAAEAKDPLARFRAELDGGDAERGRSIVINNSALSCQRCHKIDGQGGEVGPPLNGVAAKNNRDYLLESIVHPSAKIAEGYQSVILNTIDGKTLTGVLRAKTAKGYTIVTADNKVVTVPKDDVESEKPDKSAMPDDLVKKMSKRELRDVVAFLATLKEPAKK